MRTGWEAIFRRFHRGDPARGPEGGESEPGLVIAKSTAEAHGRKVEAQSELGGGMAFTVLTPVV
jgi:signal transduction histidine kinase